MVDIREEVDVRLKGRRKELIDLEIQRNKQILCLAVGKPSNVSARQHQQVQLALPKCVGAEWFGLGGSTAALFVVRSS